ncbi:MAG TPA: serine hydrolase [Microbacterium sp.]|uniref:serine hydrolase domain-containing protein n=1 Tax=Microbacterium sp. TaxID=51671 RepID=UPI002CB08B0E|nr:serine hydrolase [Microbacterium sp.]HWI30055.1 serine hydrolase [Microbacterium sp.]
MPPASSDLLARVAASPPSRRGELFPYREVRVGAAVRPFARTAVIESLGEVPWLDGPLPTADFLTATSTNALLIVRDGVLTTEWYAPGVSPERKHSSWSVAKSIVSLLIGHAVTDGLIDVDDRLVDILPEMRTGGPFDDVTVLHLLNMTSSIDVPENVEGGDTETGTMGMYYADDSAAYLARFRTVTAAPGTVGTYRSVDTAYLGMILARVTGQPLAELATAWLWQPIGAEAPARWNLDRVGVEKAYCCFNATARDFARLGRLMAEDGMVGDQRIVAAHWMERIAAPSPLPVDELPYSTQWWHTQGTERDFSALGIHGQYVYVHPATRTTIVKLSDYGTEQHELETLSALQHLATGR